MGPITASNNVDGLRAAARRGLLCGRQRRGRRRESRYVVTTLGQLQAQVLTEEIKKLREEIERKTGKTPEALYAEREKRVRDAIELRQPDRVPVSMAGGYLAGPYAGLTASGAYQEGPR